jgi:hypothetical protein
MPLDRATRTALSVLRGPANRRKVMARIKHIALTTKDPAKVADFY